MSEDNYDELHDQATDIHSHKWTPILAAHRIAANLDVIAALLPDLTPEARQHLKLLVPPPHPMSLVPEVDAMVATLRGVAEMVRQAAPFEAATDDDKQTVWNRYREFAGDESTRDRTEAMVEVFTEADWKAEAETAAIDEDPEEWLKANELQETEAERLAIKRSGGNGDF